MTDQHAFNTEVQPYLEPVKAIDLPFDYKNRVTTWQKQYGITEVPLHVRAADGQVYDDKKFKGVFKNDLYKCIVGRKYVVYPNEECDTVLHQWVDRPNSGLKIVKQYFSHHGDASYWQILSDKYAEVQEGDKVQIGCLVRNSVGTYVALGADLFTYRLICKNGAIAKGQDLGSIAVRHVGDREVMVREFSKGLEQILERTKSLVTYYKQAVKMKVNQLIAEEWAKRIPQRALPESVEVDTKTGKVKLTGSPNLWSAFNEITAQSWKDLGKSEDPKKERKETAFSTKYYLTMHAHKVLIAAVDGTLGKSRKEIAKKQ
jgi:hypothetical protein